MARVTLTACVRVCVFAYMIWLVSALQNVSVGQGGIVACVLLQVGVGWYVEAEMTRVTHTVCVRVLAYLIWLVPALQDVSVGEGGIVACVLHAGGVRLVCSNSVIRTVCVCMCLLM